MCGIVGGYWKESPRDLEKRLGEALGEMRYRGPDDSGFELRRDQHGVVALGHTRLSIIDLSAAGHQPMISRDKRHAMVFNGEIYNYRELRVELKKLGHEFASDSDSEVLLTAWIAWGSDCLQRLEGMFAFAIHDRAKHLLHCARDAFGIKPFYYEQRKGSFLFASIQSSLLALRCEKTNLDWQRSYDYLVHGDYDSDGRTFIDGVRHLPPGHLLEIDLASGSSGSQLRWWEPDIREDRRLDFPQAVELVRAHFLHNIRLQLRSDVALGAALSGGIDSSAVVCAMRRVEPELPIMTFSYIAAGTLLSEENWVDRVNAQVGAKSFKVTAGAQDLMRDLDDMIVAQGEPFGSTSIYAQYRVFQLARENGVTVTLDGQGADELMAGYTGYPGFRLLSLIERRKYLTAHRFARDWAHWPGRSYRLAAMELGRVVLPDELYAGARKLLGRDFTPAWLDVGELSECGVRFKEMRPPRSEDAKDRRVVEQLLNSVRERGLPALLRHADRNSMRFSVESRVPFLTHKFAELLLSMPEEYLISRSGETKSIFRAAMRGVVPDEILDRRDKIGFATPERDWLFAIAPQLRSWIEEGCSAIPFLKSEELLKEFDLMVSGQRRFSWQLWRWVNFVRWVTVSGSSVW